jgi:hypothetical protein
MLLATRTPDNERKAFPTPEERETMEYRLLGTSGSAVSALALGTLTFGNETDEEGSFAQRGRRIQGAASDPADPEKALARCPW